MDRVLIGPRYEIAGSYPHRHQRPAKLAADLGKVGGLVGGAECVRDLVLADREGNAVDQEADHRNGRQHDDADANRNPGDEAVRR